ncbi:MAG: AlpA family transcriptional regulator [Hydrogenovibrio sp.]|uniref:helix-turn-helix transcriptional regulator n=1 Tax=Hydrogenovibrio sp. TaxID=2065821 RepID=UPI0028700455|nr:AlpA family transcriptional regulator [Hydrogenovibrio sp.]MDR9499739.1 AlpA family transcriptional regulator [Hydrogenovibrio sp.]
MTEQTNQPRLIRMNEVRKLTGLSRSYVYALAAKGQFPKPVKLSERSAAWIESEVKNWIDERIQQRDRGVA